MNPTEALQVFRETIGIVRAHQGVEVGAGIMADRSNGTVDFGVPMFRLIKPAVEAFAPDKLPADLAAIPVVKPGSKGAARRI